jgi:hypothetical protein
MTVISKTNKSFALAATTLAALPAVAHAGTASEVRTFTRDGVKYEYTSTVDGSREILRGTADGVPFRFIVRGDYVSGYNGQQPVEFTYRSAKTAGRTDVAVR